MISRAERSGRMLPCGGTVLVCPVDEALAHSNNPVETDQGIYACIYLSELWRLRNGKAAYHPQIPE